ncbi:hypothetical protein JTB14_014804 [Gonioctena quinquepunctata]|nr:hypothetical protein JTB14_014804 [Gonioctena quinquepunctata]
MQKNGSMEEVSTKSLPMRRSQRITKGKAPIRYDNKKPDFDNVRGTEINIEKFPQGPKRQWMKTAKKTHYQSIKAAKFSVANPEDISN